MGTYRIKERSTGKVVVSDFQADGPVKAESRYPRPRGNYVIELVAAGSVQESGGLRSVSLRESLREARSLAKIWEAVVDVVLSVDASATDPEVMDDNTVVYSSGVQMFRRTYTVSDGDDGQLAVTLGNPEEVQLVVEPVEGYRASLRSASRAMNIGETESFHESFARGRGSGDPLEDIGRAFGLEGAGLRHFMRGRG